MISDSDLHDALTGTHGDNHNDLIQILGGGPWTIERNHFGVRANGAAQVYVDPRAGDAGPVHDVTRHLERLHGLEQGHVLRDQRASTRLSRPFRWRPASRSSTTRSSRANIAAIVLADEYANVPSVERPLVQQQHPGPAEARALRRRAHVHERDRRAAAPARGDRTGNPHLDPAGGRRRPRSRCSRAVRANGAPGTDLHGRQARRPARHRGVRAALRPDRHALAARRDRLACCAMEISSGVRTLTLAETFTIARGSTDAEEVVSASRSATAGTSATARALPTTATASRSRRPARSSTRAGDALGDDPFALEAIEARLRARGRRRWRPLRGRLRAPRPRRQARRAADLAPARARRPHAGDVVHDRHRHRRGHRRPRAPRGRGRLPAAQDQARRRGRPRAAAGDPRRLRPAAARRRERGLDARRGAPRSLPLLVELGVELIEQPFPAGDRDAFRALRALGERHPARRRRGLPHAARRRRRGHATPTA